MHPIHCDLSKAWSARQHLLAARLARPPAEVVRLPADFRCETGQWHDFNGSDSVSKDTKPKGFPT
jgi:hypothetical protein